MHIVCVSFRCRRHLSCGVGTSRHKLNAMGNVINYMLWGGDPESTNSISCMSIRDVHTVQKTWKIAYAKSNEYGMELFLRLFRADKNTKGYFKQILNLTEDELKSSHQFKAHVINFMTSFDACIVNLDNPEVAAALMNKLGTTHNRHGVLEAHFNVFRGVLLDFLETDLKLNDAAMESWKRYLVFMFKNIFATLQGKSI